MPAFGTWYDEHILGGSQKVLAFKSKDYFHSKSNSLKICSNILPMLCPILRWPRQIAYPQAAPALPSLAGEGCHDII